MLKSVVSPCGLSRLTSKYGSSSVAPGVASTLQSVARAGRTAVSASRAETRSRRATQDRREAEERLEDGRQAAMAVVGMGSLLGNGFADHVITTFLGHRQRDWRSAANGPGRAIATGTVSVEGLHSCSLSHWRNIARQQ